MQISLLAQAKHRPCLTPDFSHVIARYREVNRRPLSELYQFPKQMSEDGDAGSLPRLTSNFSFDVMARVLELEQELAEVHELSKELEELLEDELLDRETTIARMKLLDAAKDAKIAELVAINASLKTELDEVTFSLSEKTKKHEAAIEELKQKTIAMEIANDDFVSHDRVLVHKMGLVTQFNNELLEKNALVENDLAMEREANAQLLLRVSNLENTAKPRPDSVHEVDSTILSINEMLSSAPRMPRSESMKKIQELNSRAEDIKQKIGELNTTLNSRASEGTRQRVASARSNNESRSNKERPLKDITPLKDISNSAKKSSTGLTHSAPKSSRGLTHSPSGANLKDARNPMDGTFSKARTTSDVRQARTTSRKIRHTLKGIFG